MRRARPRVKPSNREAFRPKSIEVFSAAEAASRLGTPVCGVFVARHRVMKLIEEAMWILRGDRRAAERARQKQAGDEAPGSHEI